MQSLEQLFALEIEYHRRLRTGAIGTAEATALHTSYALQSGYESLLRSVGSVTTNDLKRLVDRFLAANDVRDMLNARDSLSSLLGVVDKQ
jgi:hypothetical protein